MGCSKTLTIGPAATGQLPMDSACYDSTDQFILSVRGGRVFKCDATTGAVLSQLDYSGLAPSGGQIVYDAGIGKCYASAWNIGHYDQAAFSSVRNLYRIVPGNLPSVPPTVDLVTPVANIFGAFAGSTALESGIAYMKNVSGEVYGVGWRQVAGVRWSGFRFAANNLASFNFVNLGAGEFAYPSFAYGKVGGTNDVIFWTAPDQATVNSWDFTASASNASVVDATKGFLSLEFANNKLFVGEELQFIDIYNASLVYQSTVNTARVAFNPVNMRLNSNDNLLYIAGGADNTVIVLNPADNSFTVKTGFDLPWDFVFTPTKKFCVQQGTIGLKEIT